VDFIPISAISESIVDMEVPIASYLNSINLSASEISCQLVNYPHFDTLVGDFGKRNLVHLQQGLSTGVTVDA